MVYNDDGQFSSALAQDIQCWNFKITNYLNHARREMTLRNANYMILGSSETVMYNQRLIQSDYTQREEVHDTERHG